MKLIPGYRSDEDEQLEALWHDHNRISRLEVTVNEEYTFPVEFTDSRLPETHFFSLDGYDEPVSELKLTITGIHRGLRFRDTCLTSVSMVHELEEKPNVRGAR